MLNIIFALLLPFAFAASPVQDILDPQAIDRSADPCENFYQFSCGGWLREFQLPPDKSSYWRQGNVLSDHVEEQLSALLASLAQGKGEKTATNAKLGAFYKTCMDIKDADSTALTELKAGLKKLEDVRDKQAVAHRLAELELLGASPLFDFASDQDPKDSSQVIAIIDRGGMSLPDPDYYLKTDAKSREIRERFKENVSKTLQLAGVDVKKTAAPRLLAFEMDMAKHAMKKDDRRDMGKRFHPMTFAQLKALVPAIDWDTYIAALGIEAPKKINVIEPAFLKNLNVKLAALKPDDLVTLLKYNLAHRAAYYVAGTLQAEDFAFWHVYLRGQKELPPRWKYCTQIVASNMSEALGQAYVASISNAPVIREKTETMFQNIKAAFGQDLDKLTWMDDKTRAAARLKLDKLNRKIGWPAKWRDYSKLEMSESFYVNELRASEFESRRNLAKIDKPVDRNEWLMSVWEPNAYYSDSNNEMVLPLGELVPPVFDPRFSEGANYSSLGGSTIGHELTHGFDDAGKDMDADGNFITWWTAAAKKKFEGQSACFIKQTEAYDIIPGSKLRIRGKATLGENLADNGGIKIGLMAFKKLMATRAPAAKFLEFDELQQFFLAYGQGWCSKISDQELRDALLTNFHPPPEFRVNQVLANQPEFAEAFHCKVGARMAPKNRCAVW